jgi:hypothetical protein
MVIFCLLQISAWRVEWFCYKEQRSRGGQRHGDRPLTVWAGHDTGQVSQFRYKDMETAPSQSGRGMIQDRWVSSGTKTWRPSPHSLGGAWYRTGESAQVQRHGDRPLTVWAGHDTGQVSQLGYKVMETAPSQSGWGMIQDRWVSSGAKTWRLPPHSQAGVWYSSGTVVKICSALTIF